MAKDKNGRDIQVGDFVQLVDPDDSVCTLPGVHEVERVFCRDLDDEPLKLKGVEGTWPSSGVEVAECGRPSGDCEPEATWQDAFFLAHPDMPRYPADMISWLQAQPLDDLRAIANNLPISNMHGFSKEDLAVEIYGCFFPPTEATEAAAPSGELEAVEGEVVPPPIIIEEGA